MVALQDLGLVSLDTSEILSKSSSPLTWVRNFNFRLRSDSRLYAYIDPHLMIVGVRLRNGDCDSEIRKQVV